MKSRHLALLDLEVEDAKCVVLRQVFHTSWLENPDFIVVSRVSKGKFFPLSPKGPPTALSLGALPCPFDYAEYVRV